MPEPIRDLPHQVLQAVEKKGSGGFYPRDDGATVDVDRPRLDAALDALRLGGFIELTDWIAQKGQGYRLTDAGRQALQRPDLLKRPAAPRPAPTPAIHDHSRDADQYDEVRRAVLEPGPAIVTRALIAMNVAVFALVGGYNLQHGVNLGVYLSGAMLPNPGALVPYEFFLGGAWWQLFTNSFLHYGLVHLGMNMYCLLMLGRVMEARWGRRRFLILYFGSGLIGGVAVLLTSNPLTRAAGASGAIAGLLASIGVWAWAHRRFLSPKFVEANFRMLGINLLLLVGIGFVMPNVSMAGHIGGAIGGALLSVPLTWMGPTSPARHRIIGVISLLLIAGLCGLALVMTPKPVPLRNEIVIQARP